MAAGIWRLFAEQPLFLCCSTLTKYNYYTATCQQHEPTFTGERAFCEPSEETLQTNLQLVRICQPFMHNPDTLWSKASWYYEQAEESVQNPEIGKNTSLKGDDTATDRAKTVCYPNTVVCNKAITPDDRNCSTADCNFYSINELPAQYCTCLSSISFTTSIGRRYY